MKLQTRSVLAFALASTLALGVPITAAYANDETTEVTVEETVIPTVEPTVEEASEEEAPEEAPARSLTPTADVVADGNINIVNATCEVGETITYEPPTNASYNPATPPVPGSYPYDYLIELVPDDGATAVVDNWSGTLTGPLDCSAEASVSTVPATCEVGEQLVYGDVVKAAFLPGGTPDGTFGPGLYDLVAESDSDVFFSNGENAAYFSGELSGPLDPSDPLCGGDEELIGEVGELLPWSAETNQPSYWEDFGPHENATCYSHSGNSTHGSITDGGKTVTLNPYGASWPGDHWELLVVKGGSVSNNVIVHPTAGVAYASPLNAAGQQSNVSHYIVCKGTTPDVETTVASPELTPGTCLATGSVNAAETDAYSWTVTGPQSARVYTAAAKDGYVLTGQTVFGPYDLRQTDWNDPACQPEFDLFYECTTDGLFVELSYTNNSKWDRWPDYSYTGDTKVPTDYGSGPTWNTVKVTPGETKVIWSYTFPEDYNGGTVDVWYQDILGAERDIDTAKVTVTLDTDCADPLPNTSTSDSTDEVCVAPGDVQGGSATFSLTAGDEGLSTTVRFKSLGDGTGGTAETFYYLDGTTGAPGEIVDYEVVTLAPGETYTTTVVDLPAGDYRFTLTGGLSNSERRALQQDVSIAAVDCPEGELPEEEPPVVDKPEGDGGLATTGLNQIVVAIGAIALLSIILGTAVAVASRRRNALQQ